MDFSTRIKQVTPSQTLALTQQAAQLKLANKPVISLAIGEPDFNPPKMVLQQAIAAIEKNEVNSYTTAVGILPLRQKIAQTINHRHATNFTAANVAVTTGAKFSLYTLAQVLLNPGDEVLMPLPYWVSYGEQVKLAQGVPVFVNPDEQTFKVTPALLEQHRTAKTKLLIINSPQNPSGMVYTREELRALGMWAKEHDVYIIADDIYGALVYNGTTFTSLLDIPEVRDHVILVSGFSKTFAMTGWRVGYTIGDEALIKKMGALIGHATGNPTAVAQYAALGALDVPASEIERMRSDFEARLNELYPLVTALPGVKLPHKPQGAFYLFVDVSEVLANCGMSSTSEFTQKLLAEKYVAIVPGEAFGMPGYVRISYAAKLSELKTAISRIAAFIDEHSN